MNFRPVALLSLLLLALVPSLRAQITINLDTVIGPSGTNAATVAGIGNVVNATGYAFDSGLTALTASGSPSPVSFDFATGFSDSLDRATGSTAGAGNVWADLKYDSAGTAPLVLDTNNNNVFDDAAVTGFGLHGDTFITFDLDAIRAAYGVGAGTTMTLTGVAGEANFTGYGKTSAAILIDGAQAAVFDWTEGTNDLSAFNLTLSGSARYLTFVGLSGLDASNWGAHVGFGNVQIQAVPEPATACLLALGALALGARRRRG